MGYFLLQIPIKGDPSLKGEIYDIVFFKEPISHTNLLIILLLSILIILTIIFLFKKIRMKKSKEYELNSREKAFNIIRKIDSKRNDFLYNDKVNEFSFKISEVIKDYLHEEYGDHVRYETIQEFCRRNESTKNLSKLEERVEKFLLKVEDLKFSKLSEKTFVKSKYNILYSNIIDLSKQIVSYTKS